MTVPYTFANAFGSLPLSELDNNFAYLSNSLADTTGNITFSNTTLSSVNANSTITIATVNGNTTYGWRFDSNGSLTLPGVGTTSASNADIYSSNSITLMSDTTGSSNITLVANGAVGTGTWIFDSSGNLSASGNIYAQNFIGNATGIDLTYNTTILGINSNISNTNSNVVNTNISIANTNSNVGNLIISLGATNANLFDTNSNVANLTVAVANNTANIATLQGQVYANSNVAAYLPTYGGNVYANNINLIGNIESQYASFTQDVTISGNLTVVGSRTIISPQDIVTDDETLFLANSIGAGQLFNLQGAGLVLGNGNVITWTYDTPTNSWQSNATITPSANNTLNLGTPSNQWANVYTGNVNATNVYANVFGNVNTGNLSATGNSVFAYLQVQQDLSVVGNLYVNGTTTTINTNSISTGDKTLVLSDTTNIGLLADGSGIQIGDPSIATLLYNYTANAWQTNLDFVPPTDLGANLGIAGLSWNNISAGAISASGNINAANVNATNVVVTNTITDTFSANIVTATGNIQSNSYILGNGYYLTGLQSSYSNANVATYLPTYDGDFTANNVSLVGNLTLANSNISNVNYATANFFSGDGSLLSNINAGNITGSYGDSNVQQLLASGTVTTVVSSGSVLAGNITATGNVQAANVITDLLQVSTITDSVTTSDLDVTGQVFINYIDANAAPIPGAGIVASTANIYDIGQNTAPFANVYAVNYFGNGAGLTGLPATYSNANVAAYLSIYTGDLGNVGNISATGNIEASYFVGNGSLLTGLPATYSNADVATYLASGNVTTDIITTGNLSANNFSTTGSSGNISGANVISAVTITVTGNVTGNYILGNGAYLTGLPATYGNTEVAEYLPTYTGNLTAGNVSVVGNIQSNNVSANGYYTTISAQAIVYVDSNGQLTGNATVLSTDVNGNVSATGNITANAFYGNGAGLANINAANIVGAYGNANVAAYLPTYSGELGNVGNVTATGNIVANNVIATNLYATTDISAAGNVTGTNLFGNLTQLYNNSHTLSLDAGGVLNVPVSNSGYANISGGTSALNVTANTSNYQFGTDGYLSVPTGIQSGLAQYSFDTNGSIGLPTPLGYANITTSGSPLTIDIGNSLTTFTAGGGISTLGNVAAGYYIGNGSQLTGMYGNANVAEYLPTYTGNLTADYISASGNVTIDGNVWIDTDTFINGNLSISGNITFIDSNVIVTDDLYVLLANNQSTLAFLDDAGLAVGNYGNNVPLVNWQYKYLANSWTTNVGITATGNVHGGNLLSGGVVSVTGNIRGGNINTAGSITATGNVHGNVFIGEGSGLANVIAISVSDNAQPNITSVGDLTSLTVTGNVTANIYFGDGSQLANVVANVDHLISGSYEVTLANTGALSFANVNSQQQQITGTVTNISGVPYPATANTTASVDIWTASSANVLAFTMTVRTQVGGVPGTVTSVELVDISCVTDTLGLGDIAYTISNRVKSNPTVPATDFVVSSVGGLLTVTATNNSSTQEYYTYSVTEFNRTT